MLNIRKYIKKINDFRNSKNDKNIIITNKIIDNIFSNKYVLSVVLFTIACLYIQYTTLIEISSTLITLWYSFWTVEIVSLAGIKVSKVFKNYKSENFIDNIDCLSEDGNDDSVG